MAKNKDINIRLNAKDRASGVFAKVGRSVGAFERRVMGAGMNIAALPAALGAAGLITFLSKSVAAAAEQEKAERGLAAAIRLVGDDSRESLDDLKAFASGIQQVTTLGDEAVLQLMSLGATSGQLAGRDLKRATTAAIGLAKAFGIDTVAAMRLVARAAVGDTAQLKRYGIMIEQTLPVQEKFNALLRIGERNFALATDEVNTLSGGIQQLKNALGDTMEIIGGVAGGGEDNWFARQAQGVSALNSALADTDSNLKSFTDQLGDLYDASKYLPGITMLMGFANKLGDFIGTKLTEDQLNLAPSRESVAAFRQMVDDQERAVLLGQNLSELQADREASAKRQAEIGAVINAELKESLDRQLKKSDEAANKERQRLDTVELVLARYRELYVAMSGATREQGVQIEQQLDGLRRIYFEQKRALLESEFGADPAGASRRAIEAESLRQKLDLAAAGDFSAEISAALESFTSSFGSRVDALERLRLSDAPEDVRRDAGALSVLLQGMEDVLREQAREDVLRNQNDRIKAFIQTPIESAIESIGRTADDARRIIDGQLNAGVINAKDAAAKIAAIEKTRDKRIADARSSGSRAAEALPDLISGRLLTGMTAAFRSGQQRANPNKGVEDRIETGNRLTKEMIRTMQDMRDVLRSGRNPLIRVGSI